MPPDTTSSQRLISSSFLTLCLLGLLLTSQVNYLLFHTLAEGFTIAVALSMFMIAWNSKNYISNPYLLFIGIAYLFIALLDLLHTLSYPGMNIFTDYDYYANQLWIGARYLESITLVIAFVFLSKKSKPNPPLLFLVYLVITALLICAVFVWRNFPICFVAGQGLTSFKVISEYIICTILLSALLMLRHNRAQFSQEVYPLLFWSIICTMISELAFTFYISNYGISNMVGHYFKIFSFCLIYKAIIHTGIEKPYNLIFRELTQSNDTLRLEIEKRQQSEAEKEVVINDLQQALKEIKTLQGILPICSHCNKIRDDKGSWSKLEKYIHDHSDAQFSHGICPDCMATHYADL